MGALHWSIIAKRTSKRSPVLRRRRASTSTPISYDEWEMTNFPSNFQTQPREEDQNPEWKGENQNKRDGKEGRAKYEWDFTLSAVVSPTAAAGAAVPDSLSAVEFDPSDTLLATGGISRKIRLYSVKRLLVHEEEGKDNLGEQDSKNIPTLDNTRACEYYICTPAKLSSLRWRPNSGGQFLGSGDYDGVVMEYDLERRMAVFERDEHGGRRVWSVDYSHWDPVTGASGSDDGTMQLWDPRCDGGGSVAAVQPGGSRSPVCSVEFNPFGGALVVAGSADRKAYGYDIRKMVDPVFVLDGHCKPVTYARFLGASTMVSSGTDGCLKLWNVDDLRMIRTFRGHVNTRNFVGLSAWRNGGLIGCGSETNQVYVYDRRWGEPVWVHGFGVSGESRSGRGFVSSVGWRQVGEEECTLVAGGSDGVLRVFVGKKRPSSATG
ncbi:WD repeat-containing protein RUP2 [Malania oleifera]|uniref:WD repeat-containing protein RUP2 n=1 Tax=Malania oleifera TaxID=397392 RepID=UPI0025ADA0E6|nr:WD repeat-containing protein RUP2 [Malania oleifera]